METTETTAKDHRMLGLLKLYDLHTDYFDRVLDGIPEEAAQNRLNTRANHIAWLAGSLVQERCGLATLLGSEIEQKNAALFANHKGIQDGVPYPPLDDFRADWAEASPILRRLLMQTDSSKLDATFAMGDMEMAHYDYVAFQTYREANCIGQIALWRRLLGLAPMNYM